VLAPARPEDQRFLRRNAVHRDPRLDSFRGALRLAEVYRQELRNIEERLHHPDSSDLQILTREYSVMQEVGVTLAT
jgi:hypothetical protein